MAVVMATKESVVLAGVDHIAFNARKMQHNGPFADQMVVPEAKVSLLICSEIGCFSGFLQLCINGVCLFTNVSIHKIHNSIIDITFFNQRQLYFLSIQNPAW